jgi:hypothetical protein
MIQKIFGSLLVLCLLLIAGCVKDEPQNPEADIESITLPANLITADPVIDQSGRKIILYLTEEAYESGLAPTLSVSNGAIVTPQTGDSIYFDNTNVYSVKSENGENRKDYSVAVFSVGNWVFNFEDWGENTTSHYQFPIEEDGSQLWSSGNPGVAFAGVPQTPESYPTQSTPDGLNNTTAAEMRTVPGTALSEMLGIRLFAGSLFIGNFNVGQAIANPPMATEFGVPYIGRPAYFSGYYKYTPGPNFQDTDGNIVAGQEDEFALYAVFFRGPERLDGTNVKTSNRLVAMAKLEYEGPKAAFTKFNIPFDYLSDEPLDQNMMVSIVCSSSTDGENYQGAIGSTLTVDSLRIIPQ